MKLQRHFPRVRDLAPLLHFATPEFNAKKRRLEKALTIHDLRTIAQKRTPKPAFDYTEGAAEAEISLARPARRSRTSSSTRRSCATSRSSTRPPPCSAARPHCRSASPRQASPA